MVVRSKEPRAKRALTASTSVKDVMTPPTTKKALSRVFVNACMAFGLFLSAWLIYRNCDVLVDGDMTMPYVLMSILGLSSLAPVVIVFGLCLQLLVALLQWLPGKVGQFVVLWLYTWPVNVGIRCESDLVHGFESMRLRLQGLWAGLLVRRALHRSSNEVDDQRLNSVNVSDSRYVETLPLCTGHRYHPTGRYIVLDGNLNWLACRQDLVASKPQQDSVTPLTCDDEKVLSQIANYRRGQTQLMALAKRNPQAVKRYLKALPSSWETSFSDDETDFLLSLNLAAETALLDQRQADWIEQHVEEPA